MFHQYPYPYHPSSYAAYQHPQVDVLGSTRRTDPLTLRNRYLAAAAEAKVAEAQYLAAEAAAQRLHDPYGPTAFTTPYPNHPRPAYNPRAPYLGYEEEPARVQALDAQLIQAAYARAQEQDFPRQKEELIAALALKQRLDKEAEEQRLAALREEERRRALAELIPQRLAKNHPRCVCPGHHEFKRHPHFQYHHHAPVSHECGHRQACRSIDLEPSVEPSVQSSSGSFNPSELLALFNTQVPDASRHLVADTAAPCAAPKCQPDVSTPAAHNGVPFLDLLTQLIDNVSKGSASEPLKPKPTATAHSAPVERPTAEPQPREVQSLSDLLTLLFPKPAAPVTQAKPSPEPKGDDKQRPQVQSLPELLNHLFQPAQPSAQAQFYAGAPSSPPKKEASNVPAEHTFNKPAVEPKAGGSEHAQIESFPELFNLLFQKAAQPSGRAQSNVAGPSSPSPAKKPEPKKEQPKEQPPVVQAAVPKATTQSLKEQLEARLNNEYATEVKDTIQALLASLSDAGPRHVATSPTAHPDDKGKGKEVATETTPVPTVDDVSKSIETVHNIETTFGTLESEFVFPAQLDFTPPSSPSTLVSPLPGTENTTVSDSAIHHLAFTARNQPLRFYEHALGELLSQLDRIDSYGNETLRARRKEVVSRVERALEELEREVDARWQIRQKKLAKESEPVPVEASTPTQEEHPAEVIEPTIPAIEESQTETPPSLVVVPPSSPSSSNTPDENSLLPPVELDVKQVSDVPSEDIIPSILSQVDERVAESQELPAPSEAPLSPPLSPEPAPISETETGEDIAPPSVTPTSDLSTATIKPTEEEESTPPIDTFLLPAQPASQTTNKTHSVVDVDSASEWSEVEA
ncbi:BAG domain-containing protein [Pleurotus pulmonarius]